MNKNLPTLSVIGLGKLGAPMAAVMARAGFEVIGVDSQAAVVEAINRGVAPIQEPQLQDYIDASGTRLRATTNYHKAILNSEVSFLILPTPSGEDQMFSNEFLLTAIHSLGQSLREKTGYHLVVITSTTMPGSTDGVIRNALEASSGREIGTHLGLCYNPEFIALGSVIRDMTSPDFILIGESDQRAGDLLESVHRRYLPEATPVRRMSCVNAELAKIAINTFVTTKISYANMLAEMCEHIAGADVDVVTRAVGSDSRIGGKYLKGALGYGGPCFPRDNKAFYALGEKLGARCDLARATDQINDHQICRLVNAVEQYTNCHEQVAVLGLSYKPDTGIIDASQGIDLVQRLHLEGYPVTAHDPMANALARQVLAQDIGVEDELVKALAGVVTLVLATPWQAFKAIEPQLEKLDHLRTIIDPWRLLDPATIPPGITLVAMGQTPPDDTPVARTATAAG